MDLRARARVCWFILGLAVGAFVLEPRAQEAVDALSPKEAGQKIVFRPVFRKSRVLVGEPAVIALYATNITSEVLEIGSQFRAAGHVGVIIGWPEGRLPERFCGLERPSESPSATYELLPGETREIRFADNVVYYKLEDEDSAEGLVFDHPTTVSVNLTLKYFINRTQGKGYDSGAFPLQVVAPAQKEDIEALADLRANKDWQRALQRIQCWPEQIAAMEAFVKKYPNSTYAPYFQLAILSSLAIDRPDSSSRFEENQKKGLTIADDLEKLHPDFVMMDAAEYLRALCYENLGQPEQTMNELMRLARQFPHCSWAHKDDALMGRYIFHGDKRTPLVPWSLAR